MGGGTLAVVRSGAHAFFLAERIQSRQISELTQQVPRIERSCTEANAVHDVNACYHLCPLRNNASLTATRRSDH